jgi:hypothetical protein
VKLSSILQLIQGIAAEITPFLPIASLIGIGAKVTGVVVDTVKRDGTIVTDDAGQPLLPDALAQKAQDTWDRAIAKAGEGSSIALAEINKARVEQGKPPLDA